MKIYIDSSVYGGYYEEEFEKQTKELLRRVRAGWFDVVYSDVVDNEISLAPTNIKRLYANYKKTGYRIVVNSQVVKLAKMYILNEILPKTMLNDAVHIALATFYDIPFLVSWDKKHIVNANRIVKINILNVENGYSNLNIVTPQKLI